MFEALYTKLPYKWEKVYDTINPFGDYRQVVFQTAWTFDIEHDVLLHANQGGTRKTPISLLRQRTATLNDFEPLSPPSSSLQALKFHSITPSWEPEVVVPERTRAFTHRLLRDFGYQWRHILRHSWNAITSRVLVRAIIRLSTLDFEVREVAKWRGGGQRGRFVWVTMLPEWEPFTTNVVRVGRVQVVICHTIEEGLLMTQEHAASQALKIGEDTLVPEAGSANADYVILSVKHIMLCRLGGSTELEYTRREQLYNGIDPPSALALDYLLWATANSSFPTRLHSLPIEVQDLILGHLSAGPVEPARVGCLLGLGSEFAWRDGPASIELQDTYKARTPWTPVDSQIWFGPHMSGIVYRGRVSSMPTLGTATYLG